MASGGALVVYGRGHSLGNLKWFAEDLPATELSDFKADRIRIEQVTRRDAFFDLLRDTDFGFGRCTSTRTPSAAGCRWDTEIRP